MQKRERSPPVKRQGVQKQKAYQYDYGHQGGSHQTKKRYKRCCLRCKQAERGRRSCVCVVPLGQRRTQIGDNGCQTCGCNGCSIEDYVSRGQDPQYKPQYNSNYLSNDDFEARNGCCKQCMKAFSKTNKSCLCQVPKQVRKAELPVSGCKVCHCNGCHPEDKKELSDASDDSRRRSRSNKKKLRNRSSSSEVNEDFGEIEHNLNTADRSTIGMLIAEAGLYAPLLGLGIPQRSYSYILGKPQPK